MKTLLFVSANTNIAEQFAKEVSPDWTITAIDSITKLYAYDGNCFSALLIDFVCFYSQDFSFLQRIVHIFAHIPVFILSVPVDVCFVVNSIKSGAVDFIEYPCPFATVERRINTYLRHINGLQGSNEEEAFFKTVSSLVGKSAQMYEVKKKILQFALSDLPVLILGESGTGKSIAARLIHDHSLRTEKQFYSYNMASLNETLIESELFGSVAGAFTDAKNRMGLFEAAQYGTLFLDEIGEMPVSMQAKILHVIETGEMHRLGSSQVYCMHSRLIFATNKNLHTAVRQHTMREDLFYRINVLNIQLPPLRSHKEDIPLLASHFLQKGENSAVRPKTLAPSALEKLMGHTWSGNVRELKNCIQRSSILCSSDIISAEYIEFI